MPANIWPVPESGVSQLKSGIVCSVGDKRTGFSDKPTWLESPCHRTIVAVDVEGSTARTDTAKAWLRRILYELFELALQAAGITDNLRDPLIDRGDGILALIHPVDQVPKTLLLNTVIPVLRKALVEHYGKNPKLTLRLRAAIHAGEVLYDPRGCFGEAVDLSIRLLDAPALKQQLEQTTTPLALVVSDTIYRTVVRHGYPGIDNDTFAPTIHTHIAGHTHHGWLYTPDQTRVEVSPPLCSSTLASQARHASER